MSDHLLKSYWAGFSGIAYGEPQIKSKIFPETQRGSFYILVFCFHGLLRHIFWLLFLPYVADAWKLLVRARTECATDTRLLSSGMSLRAPGSFLRPYYLQAPARQVTLVACSIPFRRVERSNLSKSGLARTSRNIEGVPYRVSHL